MTAIVRSGLPVLCLGLLSGPIAVAACDSAEYRVSFVATWSAETHPIEFPSNAHFSPLVGGTHDGTIAFWMPGGLASNGIEVMAETGGTVPLRNEVQAAIGMGSAGAVIVGGGTTSPGGPITTTFTVSEDHPLVTVVTMIAPSPDWFVGTNGLPLFVDGAWLDEVTVDLLPYDAGTDSGTTFTSPNQDTNPQEPIAAITGFPFAEEGDVVVPLGTFTFTRIADPGCAGDFDGDGTIGFVDVVSVLSAWGPCAGACNADLDCDGTVGFGDLLFVLSAYGPCP